MIWQIGLVILYFAGVITAAWLMVGPAILGVALMLIGAALFWPVPALVGLWILFDNWRRDRCERKRS